MTVTRQDIIAAARTYLGTPHHHQGRLRGVGVDCIGLISGVGKALGLTGHDHRRYSRHPDGVTLIRELDKGLVWMKGCKCNAEPGDVLVFWMDRAKKKPQHVAILTDYGMIHTHQGVGKVVEHRFTGAWARRLVAVYRFPGIGR